MGRNLPTNRSNAIDWINERLAAWIANAEAIGLTTEQTTQLTTLAQAATSARTAAFQARNAAKDATVLYYGAADELAAYARDLVSTIKAYAETTGDMSVYSTASVSPKDPPSPVGSPVQPTNLRATILNSGGVRLEWDGSLASGTVFEVQRKLDSQTGAPVLIGVAGEKHFIDDAVPVGTSSVQYRVRAVRQEFRSDFADPILVSFGVEPSESQGLQIAA